MVFTGALSGGGLLAEKRGRGLALRSQGRGGIFRWNCVGADLLAGYRREAVDRAAPGIDKGWKGDRLGRRRRGRSGSGPCHDQRSDAAPIMRMRGVTKGLLSLVDGVVSLGVGAWFLNVEPLPGLSILVGWCAILVGAIGPCKGGSGVRPCVPTMRNCASGNP
jgi:hypothetical protein